MTDATVTPITLPQMQRLVRKAMKAPDLCRLCGSPDVSTTAYSIMCEPCFRTYLQTMQKNHPELVPNSRQTLTERVRDGITAAEVLEVCNDTAPAFAAHSGNPLPPQFVLREFGDWVLFERPADSPWRTFKLVFSGGARLRKANYWLGVNGAQRSPEFASLRNDWPALSTQVEQFLQEILE